MLSRARMPRDGAGKILPVVRTENVSLAKELDLKITTAFLLKRWDLPSGKVTLRFMRGANRIALSIPELSEEAEAEVVSLLSGDSPLLGKIDTIFASVKSTERIDITTPIDDMGRVNEGAIVISMKP
ncbi:MAG: hypothetical protein NVS3B20_24300 [Polyangiales bacterium]